MTLVCPVGDPPGVGTHYCRICGRDYVPASDVAALRAAVTVPVQGVERVDLSMLVMAGSAGPEFLGEAAFDLERFAMRIADGPEAALIPVPSAPVDAWVPHQEPTPAAVPPVGSEAEPALASAADLAVDQAAEPEVPTSTIQRRRLVLVAGAAFAGGLLAGAGAVAGLG